jgi:eukaryotic-like serine/threonine-protein kinase
MHLDRYVLHEPIASGGMASVHLGRVKGARGFARTVAIKRLHPQFARDPEFSSMLLDEARLASAIRHPNVVPTLDVVQAEGELFMVMEYVSGESLARLLAEARATGAPVPARVGAAVVAGALLGLHAAHEARSEDGVDLQIVHRDVSPQNILVGSDGIPRLVDFGIARATVRAQATREGQLKGKLRYMAPEQLRGRRDVSRRTDVYAAGVVLWEVLTGEKLFDGESEAEVFGNVLEGVITPPSALAGVRADVRADVDRVALRALARDPADRFATAQEMAEALVAALPPASAAEVGAWVEGLVGDVLAERAESLAALEAAGEGAASTLALPSAEAARPSLPPPSTSRPRRASIPAPATPTRTLTSPALPGAFGGAPSALKPVAIEVPALAPRLPDASPAAPEPPLRPRVRRVRIAAVIAALAVLAVTLAVALSPSGPLDDGAASDPKPRAPSEPAAVAPEPTQVAAEQPPADVPSAKTAEPAPPASVLPASASAAPSSARQPRPKSHCVPPYYVDGSGIRRVKRECF